MHLGQSDTCPSIARKDLYTWQMIGATANTLEDCKTLIDTEVDYISLGPFRFTSTKENIPPLLGLDGYVKIIEALKTETPIIGVGGITTEDVTDLLATGISGIAVSGTITRDFDSITTFNQLLKASSTEEQRHSFE